MKFLLLLFLVGYATANIHEALEEEAEYIYQEFMLSLESSLSQSMGYDLIQQAEDDTKTELGKKLRETLNEILEKIKDSVDKGKVVKEDLQNKLKEIREKMKQLKVELGNKAKELMQKIRDRARDFWKEILDKLTGDQKRSIDDVELVDFNIKDMFNKLKKAILDKIDKEKLKAKIEEIFGKGNEMADSLLKLINKHGEKYKQKLLDLIDRYLEKKEEKRDLKEFWEKIKNYFKDLHIELKEKYAKFGEWVKNTMKEKLDIGKSKLENIKNIAREFIDHAKNVSKDVAVEAKEFLRPYKEDLGSLWDQVKETVKDIVNKKE